MPCLARLKIFKAIERPALFKKSIDQFCVRRPLPCEGIKADKLFAHYSHHLLYLYLNLYFTFVFIFLYLYLYIMYLVFVFVFVRQIVCSLISPSVVSAAPPPWPWSNVAQTHILLLHCICVCSTRIVLAMHMCFLYNSCAIDISVNVFVLCNTACVSAVFVLYLGQSDVVWSQF